jgi:hypothetical protein
MIPITKKRGPQKTSPKVPPSKPARVKRKEAIIKKIPLILLIMILLL